MGSTIVMVGTLDSGSVGRGVGLSELLYCFLDQDILLSQRLSLHTAIYIGTEELQG